MPPFRVLLEISKVGGGFNSDFLLLEVHSLEKSPHVGARSFLNTIYSGENVQSCVLYLIWYSYTVQCCMQ